MRLEQESRGEPEGTLEGYGEMSSIFLLNLKRKGETVHVKKTGC